MRLLAPLNPSLLAEMGRLKAARAAYHARDRQISKNMVSKLFPATKNVSANVPENIPGNFPQIDPQNVRESVQGNVLENISDTGEGSGGGKGDKGDVGAHEGPIAATAAFAVEGEGKKDTSKGDGEAVAYKEGGRGEGKEDGLAGGLGLLPMMLCSLAVLLASIGVALWLK